MKIEIVQFKDGTFGMRRHFNDRFEFADFRSLGLWWAADSKFITDCHVTLEQAKARFDALTDIGTPINEPTGLES